MDPLLSIVGLSLIALGLAWYCYRTGRFDGAYDGYDDGWNDHKLLTDATFKMDDVGRDCYAAGWDDAMRKFGGDDFDTSDAVMVKHYETEPILAESHHVVDYKFCIVPRRNLNPSVN